jgi:hypothetical protein
VPVSGLTGVTGIAAGWAYSLALTSDGTVWAWGYNADGELGIGPMSDGSSPVQVRGLTGVTAIAAGADTNHSLALTRDSTIWAWGSNVYGELGNGTTTSSINAPVQVRGGEITGIGTGHGDTSDTQGTGARVVEGHSMSCARGANVVPTRRVPRSRLVVSRVMIVSAPRPVRTMLCGLSAVVSEILRVAVRGPEAVGAKLALMVHVPFGARAPARVLMRTHDRSIHKVFAPVHLPVLVRELLQAFQKPWPDARLAPAVQPATDRLVGAKALRQVSPRRARAQDPDDAAEHRAVVVVGAAGVRFLRGKQRPQLLPLRVSDLLSCHTFSLMGFADTP